MSEFIRARSAEQKELRMTQIKEAADALFTSRPYHEITLTTIAGQLSCTRANLYKYVSSKEEIFLDLCADKMAAYFGALKAAFPIGCGYPLEVYAQVWTGILAAHQDYLHYVDILSTILETNVTVDRLAVFKRGYYAQAQELNRMLHENLGLSEEDAYDLSLSVLYHGVGICSICRWNPLVEQALERAGIQTPKLDFRQNMLRFLTIQLTYYCGGQEGREK